MPAEPALGQNDSLIDLFMGIAAVTEIDEVDSSFVIQFVMRLSW